MDEQAEKWQLWNQILNAVRYEAGLELRPAGDNPYKRKTRGTKC